MAGIIARIANPLLSTCSTDLIVLSKNSIINANPIPQKIPNKIPRKTFLILLGNIAAQSLLETKEGINILRTKINYFEDKRDYIHIKDIAWILGRLLYEWPVESKKVEYFNVATGHPPTSVKELFDLIVQISGKNIELRTDKSRIREIDRELLYPNPAKLFSYLPDYKPKSIDTWLSKLVANPGLRASNDILDKINNSRKD